MSHAPLFPLYISTPNTNSLYGSSFDSSFDKNPQVAEELNVRLCVSASKRRVLDCIGLTADETQRLTTDISLSRFHVKRLTAPVLPCFDPFFTLPSPVTHTPISCHTPIFPVCSTP